MGSPSCNRNVAKLEFKPQLRSWHPCPSTLPDAPRRMHCAAGSWEDSLLNKEASSRQLLPTLSPGHQRLHFSGEETIMSYKICLCVYVCTFKQTNDTQLWINAFRARVFLMKKCIANTQSPPSLFCYNHFAGSLWISILVFQALLQSFLCHSDNLLALFLLICFMLNLVVKEWTKYLHSYWY